MQVATVLTRSRNPFARVFNLWLALVMLTSFTTFSAAELAGPETVQAVPALSVSTSVSDPLLGGTGTIGVDVTNTGDVKGYNLSFNIVISSSLLDPDGQVSIEGASIDPTSISLDPVTGDTTIEIYDVVDLAPTESHSITIDYSIAGDATWEVGDLVVADVTAEVNDIPDNSGPWRQGVAGGNGTVIPIDLVTKTPNQTTGVHQATGTIDRVYSYTLEIQNNYVNPSHSVVVTDTVPDGVEFLGQTSGPALDAGFPWRDNATGETHLQWTLEPTTPGQMDPGENVTITYDAGIRYDYFGTDNGGNNRPHNTFDGREATATPVAHKDAFNNTALLTSEYKGSLPTSITPTDSDSASVTGAYVTIDKSGTPSVGGYGTVVDYTLTYYTSQYYSADNLTLTDTIGDGLSYVPGSASIAPDSVTHNPTTGETVLVWLPSTLGTITPASQQSVTLQATMDTTWENTPLAGQPIRAGDSMKNQAQLAADWHDQINPPRTGNDTLVASVEAGITTRLPGIYKHVWDDTLSAWTTATAATVGDEIDYRIRFNTTDGATPERSDITLGYITLTDWIPPGTSVIATRAPTVSDWADFSDTTTPTVRSINPTTPVDVQIGTLNGIEWFLGDVAADGWWETTFTVLVEDVAGVQDGLKTGNHWKLTGVNSFGQEYSDRDINDLSYLEPQLGIDKTASSVPSPLVASSDVTYTITVDNSGSSHAGDILVTDVLPADMNDTAPTVETVTLDGTPLVEDTDYKVDWTANTLSIDFYDTGAPAVDTMLPPGESIVITVRATVDAHVGAGRQLTNTASVTWNSQNDGTGRSYGPENDGATVTLSEPGISKQTDSGPIRVGDSYTSTVTVTVPAGAAMYWPEIQDRVANDGVYYVPASSAIADISGTPVEAARLDTTTPEPTRTNPTDPRTEFTWLLANMIDNRGQATDYVFELSFDLRYTGVEDDSSQEMMPPAGGDQITNDRIRIAWGYDSPVARDTDDSRLNGTNRYTDVDQPVLEIDKSVAAPGPYAGSQTATYTSVISHDSAGSWNTAYDLYWEDVLDTYMGSPALQSVTHSSAGDISGSVVADFSSAPTMTIDFGANTLDVGETITIVYEVVIDPNVPASAVQTNTADVDWSTMPGTPAGSRRFDDQPWEESWQTGDTDLQTIPIAAPTIEKRVTTAAEYTFGLAATVEITVTVPPETVLPSTAIWDEISVDGFANTFLPWSVTYVSGSPQVPAATGGAAIFDSTPSPGTNVLLPLLADIDNADPAAGTGDTPYVFKVTYYPVLTGVADDSSWVFPPPVTSMPIDDTAYLRWTVDGNDISISDNASAEADQPVLTLDKTVLTPGPYEGGDPVEYSSLITNVGDATAYSISWEDALPAQMSTAAFGGAVHSIGGDISGVITPDFSSASTVTIDFGPVALPPGESIAVTYTVDIDPGAGAGSLQFNTADVDWESLLAGPERRIYNDSAEETYTADTDIAFIQLDVPDLSKMVESNETTRSIGEEFYFDIAFSLPASTTAYNVEIADTVPDGLTVEGASILSGPGAVAVGAKDGATGETPVVWTVGTVTNPPDITLSLRVDVSMDNTFTATGVALDGLLPIQDSLVNSATIVWDDALIGGTTRTRSAQATVTVVEPDLTISKATSEITLEASQWTTYTVTIDNVGTSEAYEVSWTDVVSPELFETGVSPYLSDVLLDGVGLTPPADYSFDFGTTALSTMDLNVPLPAGSTLEVVYSAKMNGGLASGLSMPNTATVTWESSTGSPRIYGPLIDTETITSLAPSLSIAKTTTGDTHVQATGETEFTVAVTNTGDARARAVEITDTLPAGFAYVAGSSSASWPSGSSTADPSGPGPAHLWDFGLAAELDPTETLTLTFRAMAETTTVPGTYVNHAESIAEDGAGEPIASVNDTSTVWVTRPGVTVNKVLASGQDEHIQVGENVTFEIGVTNSGTTAIDILPLQDVFDPAHLAPVSQVPPADSSGPGTLSWTDLTGAGTLAPTATTTVTATFVAIGNPWSVSTIDTATVTGAFDEWSDPVPDDSETEPIDITAPSYSIDKIVAPSQATTVSIGEMVDFNIGLTNTGDTTLTAIPVSDLYDATLTFMGASPSEDASAPGSFSWTDALGAVDLAPGATTTLTTTFQAASEDPVAVNLALGGIGADIWGDSAAAPPLTGDSVTIVAPSLTITKTVDNPSLGPGETTTYTVTWENIGTGPAHDIAITDRIPDELYASGSSPSLDAVLIDGVPLAPLSYVADFSSSATATVNLLVPLPAGSTLAMVYNVTLNGGHPAGLTLTNDVSTTYSSLPGVVVGEAEYGPISDSVDIVTRAPELAITKVSTGDNQLQAGQTANYRVQVVNIGDAPAYSVVVTDTLDVSMSYAAGSSLATWSGPTTSTADPVAVGSLITWDFSGLAYISAGETLTLDYAVSVDASPVLGWSPNTAGGGADDGGGVPVASVEDTESVLITDPSAAIDKHLAPGQDAHVQVGQSVSFEIVVTNDGTTDIDLLPLTDTYDPTYLELVSATPSVDSTGVGTMGWSDLTGLGSLAVGASTTITVDFTAIAHPPTSATIDTATVLGAIDQYSDPVPDVSDTAAIGITAPSVAISKTLAPGFGPMLMVGDEVDFDLVVTNTGDTTLTVVPVSDTFDMTVLEYVSASVAPSTVSAATLGWTDITTAFGDMAPGQTETITVQFEAIAETASGVNTATVQSSTDINDDPAPGNSSQTTVTAFAPGSLTFEKSSDPASGTIMLPGDIITYYMTFHNGSPAPVPDVVISDMVPETTEYVADSMAITRAGTTTEFGDSDRPDLGEVRTSAEGAAIPTFFLGDVATAETITVSFKVEVRDAEISRGGIVNYATLSSEDDDLIEAGPVYHPVDPFDVFKTAQDINGGKLEAGDEILWTIEVINTGIVPTTNTIIRDTVPAETTYVTGSMTGPGADESGAPDLVWMIGDIAVDGSIVVTFKSTVNAGLPAGTEIVNQASAESDQSRPKWSDFPETPEIGDATLLTTGGPDWLWLLLALVAFLGGGLALYEGHRRRRARSRAAERAAGRAARRKLQWQ